MKVTTIFIIEDNKVLKDLYEYYITKNERYRVTGSFTSVESALDEFDDLRPDVILCDIELTGMSGVDGVLKFKYLDKKVKVLMITAHIDIEFIMDAFKNLADGYLTKPIDKDTLINALNNFEHDMVPLSNAVLRKIVEANHFIQIPFLTSRENEIANLLTKGYTYKRIATKLFVSASTVNFHVQNIYLKLNVKSKTDALLKIKEFI